MAITLKGDLLPYDEVFRAGMLEGFSYKADIFNANSLGCINIETVANTTGTLKTFVDWKNTLENSYAHRDITSDATQESLKLERKETSRFRTFWKVQPVEAQWTAFKVAENDTIEAAYYNAGKQYAMSILAGSVKDAIGIVSAAIESGGTSTVMDLTSGTDKNINILKLIQSKTLFGDMASNLRALVCHSAVAAILLKDQAENYMIDAGAGMVIYGRPQATGGIPLIVTDQPALTYTVEGATYYKSLLLSSDAVALQDNGNTTFLAKDIAGHENIKSIIQGEGDRWNYVKGYQLKASASPGENPTPTVLNTSSNWEKYASSYKQTAGIVIKSAAVWA